MMIAFTIWLTAMGVVFALVAVGGWISSLVASKKAQAYLAFKESEVAFREEATV